MLKIGGRATVVIKNKLLSNSDNASRALRQELLSSCNLHTILDCPSGTFIGAGIKTVVLFFEKGKPFDAVQGTPLFSQGNFGGDWGNAIGSWFRLRSTSTESIAQPVKDEG
ncbi:MAG: SAM-dependent methyltransferase [Fischerella sp. CENA71]|nr:SAM-dependent methyltransferase [Fischerella sp. CENA71]